MIALLIGYEAVSRFISPVAISFDEAIPIAVLGLLVNVASVLLLSGGEHHHHHGYGHAGEAHDHDEAQRIETGSGAILLEIFEKGVPPRFRLSFESGPRPAADAVMVESVRPGGGGQVFACVERDRHIEYVDEIPPSPIRCAYQAQPRRRALLDRIQGA